ncbi:MAG: T9SS type A sorting domain-containing protein [Chitinophagales bacterium]
MAIDKDDNLWLADWGNDDGPFSSDKGLTKYTINSGTWYTYNTSNSTLPYNQIYSISTDTNSHVWLGYLDEFGIVPTGAITEFNGNNIWHNYTANNSGFMGNWYSQILVVDHQNNVWFVSDSGLFKYDGISFQQYHTPYDNIFGIPDLRVGAAESGGIIWFGGTDAASNIALIRFDGVNWTSFTYLNSGFPSYSPIRYITIDENNIKWIGTDGGVVKLEDDSLYTVYNTANSGLSSNLVSSIAIDPWNNKWICTYDGGLSAFREGGLVLSNSDNILTFDNSFTTYPTPFSQSVYIDYTLSKKSFVSLEVFNLLGHKVKTILQNENQSAGKHQNTFSGVGEGIYFVKMIVDGKVFSQKVICEN